MHCISHLSFPGPGHGVRATAFRAQLSHHPSATSTNKKHDHGTIHNSVDFQFVFICVTRFTFTIVLYKGQKRRDYLHFTDEEKEAKSGFATDTTGWGWSALALTIHPEKAGAASPLTGSPSEAARCPPSLSGLVVSY